MNERAATPTRAEARRPLPALAMPKGREDRRAGVVLSVLVHALIIGLLIAPFAVHQVIVEREQGAGGPGPAGGGGGGRGGTGGQREPTERLRFIQVVPTPVPTPNTIPPPKPQTQVVPPPVVPPPKPEPKAEQPPVQEKPAEIPLKSALDVAVTPGTGGGTGNDGTNGSGPGTGGGVGTGVGTGRGSGVGPGTGGGRQENYPPTPIEMFIPPMPVPDRVKGFHLVAEFDVDETGRVVSFDFTPTRDGDYNKKLREIFKSYRFRPGARPDGTPIRMKAQIAVDIF